MRPILSHDPFRHIVIDNFLPSEQAIWASASFPRPKDGWYSYDNVFENKWATDKHELIPSQHMEILLKHNASPFITDLETLFDMPGLIPDPSFRGGGLHYIKPGGKLDIHADFNWHTHLKLDRRLNAILYLNPDWKPEYGGHLELWDKEMKLCVKKIEPLHNRMVIFETTDFSYHGHPDPFNGPEGSSRKSMAWYFYTNGRPEHEKTDPHSTMFKKRPQDQTSEEIEALRQKRNNGRIS